jgi:hypothetical protein
VSGGALLCLNKSGEGWLSVEEEETAVKMFNMALEFIREFNLCNFLFISVLRSYVICF